MVQLTPRTSPEILRLPPAYKWEFLRRHPEYVHNWQLANIYWRTPLDHPGRRETDPDWRRCELAKDVLRALTGLLDRCYPDPSTPAAELAGGFLCDRAGQENARPVSNRELAERLLLELPRETLKVIGAIFYGEKQDGGQADDLYCLEMLTHLRDPELDRPAEGLLAFGLHAPLEGIQEQIPGIVKAQKATHQIKQARRRPGVLDDYLATWDMREGWAGGDYDPGRESTLRAVAAQTGAPVETVRDRYCSAYRLVFAEKYDPLRWAIWFRRKLRLSRLARGRKPKTPGASVGTVPETTLMPGRDDGPAGLLEGQAAGSDDSGLRALIADINALLEKGKTNEQIIIELDLHVTPGDWEAALNDLRTRQEDGLG
jgi:hypothetical protein